MPLGEEFRVGEWLVTVVSFDGDVTAAASSYMPNPPEKDLYAGFTYRVTFSPGADHQTDPVSGDPAGRTVDFDTWIEQEDGSKSFECHLDNAYEGNGYLTVGQSATIHACADTSSAALGGGIIAVTSRSMLDIQEGTGDQPIGEWQIP